jgi:multicomponent K+:H+ antiporter subunit E
MKRWLPYPLLSLLLALLWLMLAQSLEPAHWLLGALLGVAMPLATRRLQPLGYVRPKKPIAFARLLAMALFEIVRSAIVVFRYILFFRQQGVNAQFVRIPLELRSSYGLALLSCLINMTPGTVWAEILPGTHVLALHVLDLHDEQWWIDTIKTRYEKPLIEIFD